VPINENAGGGRTAARPESLNQAEPGDSWAQKCTDGRVSRRSLGVDMAETRKALEELGRGTRAAGGAGTPSIPLGQTKKRTTFR